MKIKSENNCISKKVIVLLKEGYLFTFTMVYRAIKIIDMESEYG